MRLLHEVESAEGEERALAEFRREMELLQQEKMAHVEVLRQIHADINAMETVMKQAEEAKRNATESARRSLEDYAPLKHDVDLMRTELLGLERLPELPQEDRERMGTIGLLDKPKLGGMSALAALAGEQHGNHPWHQPPPGSAEAGEKAAAFFGLGRHPAGAAAGHAPNPFLAAAAAQHSALGLGPLGPLGAAKADQLRTSLQAQASSVAAAAASAPFRQQPPPMKSCLSCHQQIHRNAPICPLCKAKSRSRNPKKPKKKD